MAVYHFHAQIVSRGKGHSAIAGVAYRTGLDLYDERTQERKDYSRRSGVEWFGQFSPKDAPEWAQDIEQFWNKAEAVENRKDAQLAREFDLSFPHELDAETRRRMITDFVRDTFTRNGIAATVAIHSPDRHGDQRNYHAHVMLALRRIDEHGFSATKDREHNKPEHLEAWREKWAKIGARQLERAGYETEAVRWSHGHKTLEHQRIIALERGDFEFAEQCNRAPSEHRGAAAEEMQKRGAESDRIRELEERKEQRARDERERQRLEQKRQDIERALEIAEAQAIKMEFERSQQPEPAQPYQMTEIGTAWWKASRAKLDYHATQTFNQQANDNRPTATQTFNQHNKQTEGLKRTYNDQAAKQEQPEPKTHAQGDRNKTEAEIRSEKIAIRLAQYEAERAEREQQQGQGRSRKRTIK